MNRDDVLKLEDTDDLLIIEDEDHNLHLTFNKRVVFEKGDFINLETASIYQKGVEDGAKKV